MTKRGSILGLSAVAALLGAGGTAGAERSTPTAWTPPPAALVEHARALLQKVPLIDGHNDLPWQLRERAHDVLGVLDLRAELSDLKPPLHTDIPRLRRGGVGGQFWSVYVPVELKGAAAVEAVLEQIDLVHRLAARYPETFEDAATAADIERIHRAGRIASLVGVEGGHSIDNSLAVLRELYAVGARYMTLTHSSNTDWADSATDAPAHGGLTPFGKEVVGEMNRLGMLVDLSHVAATTMRDAMATSAAPVIFSHSSVRALSGHPRTVPDEELRLLAKNGGVDMVSFVTSFTSEATRQAEAAHAGEAARLKSLNPGDPERVKTELAAWDKTHPVPPATLAQVADNIDHVRQVAGIDHVGLGSDFDGMPDLPEGIHSVADYPVLLAELLRRGYSDEDVEKVAGLNLLRVLRAAEATSARLRAARPPSEARIEDFPKPAPSIP